MSCIRISERPELSWHSKQKQNLFSQSKNIKKLLVMNVTNKDKKQ